MGGAPCVQLKLGSARMRAACYRSKFRQISYLNYLDRSRPLVDRLAPTSRHSDLSGSLR